MSSTRKNDGSDSPPTRRRKSGLLGLRRRTKSAKGAIVLSGLTVAFIALSYRTGNVLFQFDSIVSFLAALVLLFRDTSHRVQARVVNRILTSSHELVADLSDYGLGGSSFLYVPEGRKVGDVMLVPVTGGVTAAAPDQPTGKGEDGIPAASGSASSQPSPEGVSELRAANNASGMPGDLKDLQNDTVGPSLEEAGKGEKRTTTSISNLKFAPPGRAMAELFLRESALKDPTMDDIIAAIPVTLVDGFQLADSSSVNVKPPGDETVEVTLVHPVLNGDCRLPEAERTGIVGCEVCSMLAVLFSSSTSRLVSLDGCAHDETRDVSTTSLHLGAKYPAD